MVQQKLKYMLIVVIYFNTDTVKKKRLSRREHEYTTESGYLTQRKNYVGHLETLMKRLFFLFLLISHPV